MISRSLRILAQPLLKSGRNIKAYQPVRNDHWVYRDLPPKSAKWTFYAADGLNAFFWWWIFIHCYYDFGHLVGEYEYPKPEKWTDAELGVVDCTKKSCDQCKMLQNLNECHKEIENLIIYFAKKQSDKDFEFFINEAIAKAERNCVEKVFPLMRQRKTECQFSYEGTDESVLDTKQKF